LEAGRRRWVSSRANPGDSVDRAAGGNNYAAPPALQRPVNGVLTVRGRALVAATAFLATTAIIVVPHLQRVRRSAPPVPIGQIVSEYASMPDDEARWQLVVESSKGAEWAFRDFSVVTYAKDLLASCGGLSYVWFKAYPEIVRRLEVTWQDLYALARALDFTGRAADVAWSGPTGPLWPGVFEMSRPELARAWLKRLTGRNFDSLGDVDRWLVADRDRLRWNATKGVFEVLPPSGRGGAVP
jgi:hypothetical protein